MQVVRKIREIEDLDSLLADYRKDLPVEIEIGCGNGHFITDYGERKTHHLLIGIDRKRKRCQKSVNKINNRNLPNIFIIYGRAEELVRRIPRSSVKAFHIYFPDPWPKNKHRRRRFFRMSQLETLHLALEPGGRIFFVSDFFDYYLQAKLLMALHPGFDLEINPPSREIFKSLFSRRFLSMGKKIHYTCGRKRSPSGPYLMNQVTEDEENQEKIGDDIQSKKSG